MDIGSLLSKLDQGARAGASHQNEPRIFADQSIGPTKPLAINDAAAVYHGADDPISESLLARSGVDAYTTLLNISILNEKYEKAWDLLTNGLGRASVGLQQVINEVIAFRAHCHSGRSY